MLSRRNIRVKIMQLHYAKRLDSSLSEEGMKSRFKRSIDQSYNLYLFNVLQLVKTTEVAYQDAQKRKAKYLPTEEDKKFSPKICDNKIIETINQDVGFNQLIKDKLINNFVNSDMSRLFYTEFAKTKEYLDYIQKDSESQDHKEILLQLYKFCLNNENYSDYVEEKYENWIHDKSLIVGAMKKTIKSLENTNRFYQDYIPADEETLEFGDDLLHKTIFFDSELLTLIEPALKNWKVERVAVIDLILLKMAVCEMLHFPTIPLKVTINEYVDISKIYSTPKSKDFINGILDRLMKKLTESGQIKKEGRGLVD